MYSRDTTLGLRSFNLLPWRDQRYRYRRRNALFALACGAVAALSLVVAIDGYFRHQLHAVQVQGAEIQAAIDAQKPAAAGLQELEAQNAQLAVLATEIERVQERNETVREWLAALPEAVPADLLLTRMQLSGNRWEMQGTAADLDQAALLLQRLRKMPMVWEARLEEMQNVEDHSRQFVLAGRLRE